MFIIGDLAKHKNNEIHIQAMQLNIAILINVIFYEIFYMIFKKKN